MRLATKTTTLAILALAATAARVPLAAEAAPPGLDWICVSPKANAPVVLTAGDELKLVYPQSLAMPERFEGMAFRHFLLQPMDGPDQAANTRAALAYCLAHPQWRLSVQTHKVVGIR